MVRTLARRVASSIALAGVLAAGAVVVAPAASAEAALDDSVDGSYVVVDGVGGAHGPRHFLLTDSGRRPVFFCDADNPHKQAPVCVPSGPRF